MASINKLVVTKSLDGDKRFAVKKGFLGIGSSLTYVPTGSSMKASVNEYGNADGDRLARMLRLDREQMLKELAGAELTKQDLGNARLEVLQSEDTSCVVLQLHRFVDFSYSAVTDAIVLEGDQAKAVANKF